jgi:hypothetical protein
MIDAILIADQGVGQSAEIQQAVPLGVVACKSRDFDGEDESHAAKGDFGSHDLETLPMYRAGTRKAQGSR